MDLLNGGTAFARLVGDRLGGDDAFRLVDVGCSGGIDSAFRAFGDHLAAWAFDIDGAEVQRLCETESSPRIRYVHGRVGLPDGHPFLVARSGRGPVSASPWDRLSAAATARLRRAAAPQDKTSAPAASATPVELGPFLDSERVSDIDFLKIDVDGEDFAILSGFGDRLEAMNVIGVGIEVGFFGTDHPSDHTLHNVDRFMRHHGYDLFGLTVRHYSTAVLPARYVYPDLAAETHFGRPFLGDALYARDPCAEDPQAIRQGLGPSKLAKLAALFSLAGLPDCSAEILTRFRADLDRLFDIDAALDLLVAAAREDGMPAHYPEYMRAFAEDALCFYARRARAAAPPDRDRDLSSARSCESQADAGAARSEHGRVMDALIAQNASIKEELLAIRRSRSWRITAPLRRATAVIRRLHRG